MMKQSEIINQLLFDYLDFSEAEIKELCGTLKMKQLRWLGANHPDNRTRKYFFELSNISIGQGAVINYGLVVSDNYLPLLSVGERVAISPNVNIICASSPNNSKLVSNEYVKEKLIREEKVIIKDDVWIGTNVVILPGVTVGRSSIVGAGSVVSRDIDEFSIYAGVPARKVKSIE